MVRVVVKKEEAGRTLEKYLQKIAPLMPRSLTYKLFRKKDVKVNGHWQDNKYVVNEGDEVTIYIDQAQFDGYINDENYHPNDYIKDFIIFEDENVLIINKPRGILVQGDKSGDKPLDKMVIEYLLFKGEYPEGTSSFECGPAHRLDRNTSGIIVFGKNNAVLRELTGVLKDHKLIEKHYECLVLGQISDSGEVNAPLKKDESTNMVYVTPIKEGGKDALTIYKPVRNYQDFTLVDIELVTGRTHQIRVHMASIKHPVIGDNKYGNFELNHEFNRFYNFRNQFLHAKSLTFKELDGPLAYLSNKTFIAEMPKEYLNILETLK